MKFHIMSYLRARPERCRKKNWRPCNSLLVNTRRAIRSRRRHQFLTPWLSTRVLAFRSAVATADSTCAGGLYRHPALAFCLSMIPRVKPEGMLFGKPDSTRRVKARRQAFPDHALSDNTQPPAQHFLDFGRRQGRTEKETLHLVAAFRAQQ